jgi:hypothetical protein
MTSDLTTQLRAARPAAPPELRERVRAIASQASSAERGRLSLWPLRVPRMRLAVVPVAAALVLVSSAIVFGLARSGSNEVSTDLRRAATTAGGAEAAPSTAHGPGTFGPSTSDQSLRIMGDRAQRVAATLTVEVHDSQAVSSASQDALELTRSLGGRVVSASVATGDEGTASLTVRVPVGKAEEAIVGLSALGRITSQKVTIDDLQEGLDSLVRRAASVRSQIVRITARLRSEDLDAETRTLLEARRRALRNQLSQLRHGISATRGEARMATIELGIVTPGASGVAPVPSRFDRTMREALNVLLWEAVVALAALVVVAPFVLAVLGVWLGRHLRRRHDEQLLAAH